MERVTRTLTMDKPQGIRVDWKQLQIMLFKVSISKSAKFKFSTEYTKGTICEDLNRV